MSRRDDLKISLEDTAAPRPEQAQIYPTRTPNIPARRRGMPGQFLLTGLVIENEITQEEWLSLRETIQTIKRAYQWVIGDWMLYGMEHGWAQDYEQMAEYSGLKAVTVKNYTYVCRNIPASLRSDKLSFAHFQLIAALADDRRQRWIARAISEKLSVNNLRVAINASNGIQELAPPPLLDRSYRRNFNRLWKSLEAGDYQKASSLLIDLQGWIVTLKSELKTQTGKRDEGGS